MKIKKFNLFITSNDVNDFGKSYSIGKKNIYIFIFLSIVSLFFLLFGLYSFFLKPEFKLKHLASNPIDEPSKNLNVSLSFINDPVKFKNKPDFETSFITRNFTDNHTGIDINGNVGTKIYSPMSGKVIYEAYNKKLGNIIIISHDNGYITKYMHNKKKLC